jgi:hypothetical protein
MANALEVDVDLGPLIRATEHYATQTEKGFNAAFQEGMKGMVRRALAITPPASRNSSKTNGGEDSKNIRLTNTDKERGKSAIDRDLFAVFSGQPTNGTRKKAKDDAREIERIHARLFVTKTPGRKLRSDLPAGQKYPVTESALNSLRRLLKTRVGFVASGWNSGARSLKISPPQWVSDKNAAGTASVQLTGVNRHAVITNGDIPDKMHNELSRRVRAAQEYQIKAIGRRLAFITGEAKRKAGL